MDGLSGNHQDHPWLKVRKLVFRIACSLMIVAYWAMAAKIDPLVQLPTYPSNCLHFLRSMGNVSRSEPTQNTTEPLNVVVVGAGLGGLASAIALARKHHTVTIYEQAHQLAEV